MPRFITLTKIEAIKDEDGHPDFEESEVHINTDHIAYTESRVVHLADGTSFLCRETEDEIVKLITKDQ